MFETPLIFPNCKTLKINYSSSPERILLNLNTSQMFGVTILVEDRMKALARRLSKSHSLDYIGPPIVSKRLNPNYQRFILRIAQTIDLEEDPGSRCINYPTKTFASFRDCDERFVYQEMKQKYNLMPFWAAKSPDEVTKLVHYNKENLTIPPWRYLLEGSRESKCQLPCKSTKVFGALWSSNSRDSDQSAVINIRFHHEVSITESYFPSFSLPSFFADLGGSLGLWLGVGAVQIIGYCLLCSKWVKRTFCSTFNRNKILK